MISVIKKQEDSLIYFYIFHQDQKISLLIQFFHQVLQMEVDEWQFPQKKQTPMSISYSPKLTNNSQSFLNPFLGYPVCPIIGRYNRGQYKIGETLMHIEFKCVFNKNIGVYCCGGKEITLPEQMHYNIRNIPQIISNNKPSSMKNVPDYLPEKYPVLDELSVIWIISFGELGKDFLNYLNHMYVLANTLFEQERLQRKLHYLPIYAYLPPKSGIRDEEVDKGLNFNTYRGQYMSFHLNKGAPAFSPNNMRLGVEGGKVITSKQQTSKQNKKGKVKYIEKQKFEQGKKQKSQKQEQEQVVINWEQQIYNKSSENVKMQQGKPQGSKLQGEGKHQGFVHFYTSVLLEKDYRIYYHWHIEDQYKEDMLKQIVKTSMSIQDFGQKYSNLLGKDCLYFQLNKLLFSKSN